jgi:hypothetical protein
MFSFAMSFFATSDPRSPLTEKIRALPDMPGQDGPSFELIAHRTIFSSPAYSEPGGLLGLRCFAGTTPKWKSVQPLFPIGHLVWSLRLTPSRRRLKYIVMSRNTNLAWNGIRAAD